MPETCDNWLGLVQSCVYYAHQTREIYQVLSYSVDFWNILSEIMLRKCSFILNKGLVNIWNDLLGGFLKYSEWDNAS